MKQRLFYLFLIPLLVGCSNKNRESRIDTSLTARDEFGVRYNPDDLKKENVFKHSYSSLGWDFDANTLKSKKPYFRDIRFNPSVDYTMPTLIDFYIQFNPDKIEAPGFNTFIPVLTGDFVTKNITYGFNCLELPKYTEADFSYSRLDFPTTDTLYFTYLFHTSVTLDFESIADLFGKNDINLWFGIEMLDPEAKKKVNLDGTLPDSSQFVDCWSNTHTLSISYEDDKVSLHDYKYL